MTGDCVFHQRSKKVCLHAAIPVASEDLNLSHVARRQCFLKRKRNGRITSIHVDMRLQQGKGRSSNVTHYRASLFKKLRAPDQKGPERGPQQEMSLVISPSIW